MSAQDSRPGPRAVGARLYAFLFLAVALAIVFVRLGFWQIDRLGERRARNAVLERRLAAAVVPFEELRDTTSFMRARVFGVPDHDREIVYTGRSRNGSPGVYVLTPMRRENTDTAVIVIRGWVYAPDAATVELARWRENRASYHGYVASLTGASGRPAGDASRGGGRAVRSLSYEAVSALLPYPVARQYLVAQDSVSQPDANPARLALPVLDGGPHLSYAIQWFSFATIALVGAAVVLHKARSKV